MSEQITIALVDDHPIVLEGLRSLLNNYSDRYRVLICSSGADILALLTTNKVDVVLLDISLPDVSGLDVCMEIKQSYPQTIVVGLSNQTEQSIINRLLQNGGGGFILKSEPAAHILRSIEVALRGEVVMSTSVRDIVFSSAGVHRDMPALTKREKQLLQLLAEGKTTTMIADELFLSRFTVDTYRKNLLKKFDVKNSTELVTLLLKERLI